VINVAEARVALRERGLWDVLDVALRFFVANARAYFWPSFFCVVPSAVISTLVGAWQGPTWGWLTAFGLSLFAATPVTVLTSRLVFDARPKMSEVLTISIGKNLALLPLRIVQLFLVALGTVFMVIPGVWLAVLFFTAPEIMVAESSGPMATISRAQRIVGAAFGDMALISMVVLAGRGVAVLVLDIAGRALLTDLLQVSAPPPIWESYGGAISYTAFFLILPLEAVARFFSYLNVRTKTEGWDIQARFLEIARRHDQEVGS
jgi:hypothetical protein